MPKKNRITIFEQANLGAGVARNTGLKHARGQYIIFLDSDDYFEPSFLEKMLDRAIATNADIVVCNLFYDDESVGQTQPNDFPFSPSSLKTVFSPSDVAGHIFNWFRFKTWNKLFRLDFIRQHALQFQTGRSNNDVFFTCASLATAKRLSVIDERLVYWRINQSNSITRQSQKIVSEDIFHAWHQLKLFLEKENLFKLFERSLVNAASLSILYECNRRNIPNQAILYDLLRNRWLKEIGLSGYAPEFFYEKKHYQHLKKIENNTILKSGFLKRIRYYLFSKITFWKKHEYYKEKYEREKDIHAVLSGK